jgi:hypothetical protein
VGRRVQIDSYGRLRRIDSIVLGSDTRRKARDLWHIPSTLTIIGVHPMLRAVARGGQEASSGAASRAWSRTKADEAHLIVTPSTATALHPGHRACTVRHRWYNGASARKEWST